MSQKWPEMGPKYLQCEKMKKNEPNSQMIPVFWLVTEAIHEVRGISPYGDLWGTLGFVQNYQNGGSGGYCYNF